MLSLRDQHRDRDGLRAVDQVSGGESAWRRLPPELVVNSMVSSRATVKTERAEYQQKQPSYTTQVGQFKGCRVWNGQIHS